MKILKNGERNKMRVKKIDERIKEIADFYGKEAQLDMLQEECAELIQAVSKFKRGKKMAIEHIAEEICDVELMITQIMYLLNICYTSVNTIKEEKITRTLNIIEQIKKVYEGND